MRLFIAVNFNDGTRNKLMELRGELVSRSVRGDFSLPENLHLTLTFLGECGLEQTAAAKSAVDATGFAPFNLWIERIGRFKRNGGGVWWAGVKESKQLLELQSNLTNRLITAGFALDKRPYSPHITLGREVVTDAVPWQIEPFGETVKSIQLMKSERINGKLIYTVIYTKEALL